jgi:hypothetical protein
LGNLVLLTRLNDITPLLSDKWVNEIECNMKKTLKPKFWKQFQTLT